MPPFRPFTTKSAREPSCKLDAKSRWLFGISLQGDMTFSSVMKRSGNWKTMAILPASGTSAWPWLSIFRLALTSEVSELAGYYVHEGAMPLNDLGDAFHLAFASWYRVQYLLTWNCKHL